MKRLTDDQHKLAEDYLSLLVAVTRRSIRVHPYLTDDLVGYLALEFCKCAGRWDASHRVRFATYFHRRARGAVADLHRKRLGRPRIRPCFPGLIDSRFYYTQENL